MNIAQSRAYCNHGRVDERNQKWLRAKVRVLGPARWPHLRATRPLCQVPPPPPRDVGPGIAACWAENTSVGGKEKGGGDLIRKQTNAEGERGGGIAAGRQKREMPPPPCKNNGKVQKKIA